MADGSTIIPATRRPDGTWRKEIRVRPGFVPLEEAGAYKSPAQRAMEARNGLPVGASPDILDAPEYNVRGRGSTQAPVPNQLLQAIQRAAESHGASALPPIRTTSIQATAPAAKVDTTGLTASQKRSVKRGEKRREAREDAAAERLAQRMAEAEAAVSGQKVGTVTVTTTVIPVAGGAAPAPPADTPLSGAQKALKKAQKALRQVLDLESQAASNPDKPLNEEQQEKIGKKWGLLQQVEELSKRVEELGGRSQGGEVE